MLSVETAVAEHLHKLAHNLAHQANNQLVIAGANLFVTILATTLYHVVSKKEFLAQRKLAV
jgi:hypothetical protein